MDTKKLRQKILDLAIHGKLVPPVCRQAGKTLTMNPEPPIKGKKCWFTYVIECEDGSFYKGYTDNLLRRYKQHCDGNGAEYTKKHKPKQLYYWEMHYTQENALNREKYLKSGIGREWFKREVVDKPENFEPASVLLERIRAEKERLVKEGKIKKSKASKTSDTPHYENRQVGEANVPFEVPGSWEWCKLEDIAYVASGSTPNKDSFVPDGIPYIKMYNLRNQKIDFDFKPQYIKEDVHNGKLQRSRTEIGDLIMNIVGPPLGKLAIIPHSLPQANFNQAAVLIRPLLYKNVLVNYLFYYLSEMSEIDSISTKGSAGQVNISLTQSQNMKIPLPPLTEQKRIIVEIERWFALIDTIENGKMDLQTTIKQAKSKILDLAIHGKLVPQDPNDEPATELLKRINPKAEITCDNGQYGKIPVGWYRCQFGEYLDVRDGTHDSPKYVEKGYPFVTSKNLSHGKIDFDTTKFISEEDHIKFSQRSFVEDGDILFAMIGSIGNPVLIVKDREFSIKNVALFKPYDRKNTYMEYVLYYLLYIQETLKQDAKGGMQPFIPLNYFRKDLHIPLPPIEEQHRIVTKIEELFTSLDNIQKALEV